MLRKQGTTVIKCPYCGGLHDHDEPGHHVALCEDGLRDQGMFVGDRFFVPNYGYTICKYKEGDGVNGLIVPDNLVNDYLFDC